MALIPIVKFLEDKDVVMAVNDSKTVKHADYPNKPACIVLRVLTDYI